MRTGHYYSKEGKRKEDLFFAEYIRKNTKAYSTVLSMILLIELVMAIRGIILFDFSLLRHRLYFISYLFLFLTTGIALFSTYLYSKEKMSSRAITIALYLYCSAIMAWSLLVTWNDLVGGNAPLAF